MPGWERRNGLTTGSPTVRGTGWYDGPMPSRADDWWRQAERDLSHARHSLEAGDHEWACFAAQQAAEKAIKALYQRLHMEAWGHVVHRLLEALPPEHRPDAILVDAGRRLDRFYIPARYPNGFASGAPGDFFTEADARSAIADAEAILEHCSHYLA